MHTQEESGSQNEFQRAGKTWEHTGAGAAQVNRVTSGRPRQQKNTSSKTNVY